MNINMNEFLRAAGQTIKAGVKEMDRLITLGKRGKELHARVAQRMIEPVRNELAISYSRSGLAITGTFKAKDGDAPGALYAAAVTNVEIARNLFGLRAYFPAELNEHIYARGGVFQYGGVRGVASKKTKRALKNNNKGVLGGGYSVIEPRPYFDLDGAQYSRLLAQYKAIYQEEVDNARSGS